MWVSVPLLAFFATASDVHPRDENDRKVVSGASGEDEFQLVPEVYCSNDVADQYASGEIYNTSHRKCEALCRQNETCRAYEMDCGVRCRLLPKCSKLWRSGCHSYVGMYEKLEPRILPSEPFVLVPALVGGTVLVALSWLTVFYCSHRRICCFCVDMQRDESEIHMTPRLSNLKLVSSLSRLSTTTSSHLGEDAKSDSALDCYWTIAFIILGLCAVLCVASLFTVVNLPPDTDGRKRGLCGLVHKDLKPFCFKDLLSRFGVRSKYYHIERVDPYFLINGTVHLAPALNAMPMDCWRILVQDTVSVEAGPGCYKWCDAIGGNIPRFWCMLLPDAGHIYRTCSKVLDWKYFAFVPHSWGSIVCASIYLAISLILGYQKSREKAVDVEQRYSIDVRPSSTTFEVNGPYRASKFYPLVTSNDQAAARFDTSLSTAPSLLDPLWDMNASLTFIFDGQYIYGSAILSSILGPHLDDPFQSEDVAEAIVSGVHLGFSTQESCRSLRYAGMSEGIVSMIVGMHALMRNAYNGTVPSYIWVANISMMILSSFFFSLPNALVARDLLEGFEGVFDFGNYYALAKAMTGFPARKYLVSFDATAFAVVVARTFTDIRLLFKLWLIGAVSGFLGWSIFVVREGSVIRSRETVGWGECRRQVLLHFGAFFFWPIGLSRLSCHSQVWKKLARGEAKLREAIFLGYASFPVSAYYPHRIITFGLFWVVTFVSDKAFYLHVWDDFNRESVDYHRWDITRSGWWVLIILVVGWGAWLGLLFLTIYNIRNPIEHIKEDFMWYKSLAERTPSREPSSALALYKSLAERNPSRDQSSSLALANDSKETL